MKQGTATLIANLQLGPSSHLIRLTAPEIARHAVAGQFVHVRVGKNLDPLLRRPFSIARVVADGRDDFTLLIEVIGRGSAMLAAMAPGERLDVLGPLGRGFRLDARSRHILLVAGGAGIAPLLALAAQALERDVAVTLLFGARAAYKVFPADLIPPQVEYVVLTEDGSFGRQGLVTAAILEYWDEVDQIFACGPPAMLRAVAGLLRPRLQHQPPQLAQVSLEQHMSCAMGACYGCVIETTDGHRRVCRDGPVFELTSLEWQ